MHVNMAGKTKTLIYCGDWRLDREIGRGAYGIVYLAEGANGDRAAVKVCRRDEIGEERYARELRGARLYCAIPRTAGLVCMKELVEKPWGFYSVMDLADHEFDGEPSEDTYRPKTLASILGGVKALSLDESVKLGIALAKGLETLQRHHLLHRDIKPGNVIYVGGRPVLSDPGLIVEESEAASLVGTPGYVPPENFTAAVGDIYSLGLTLKAASFGRRIEDIDKGPALEADTSAAQFPAWWRILNKATDPTPSRRYQSAKALLKELEGLRRKMKFAAIVESTIAKVVLALALLGAVAVLVANVVAGRRAEDEIARQSAENRALKDDMARQSEENKKLKDGLAQTARLVAIWNDASTRFGNLGGVAKSMIDYWSITQLTYVGNNSNLKAAKEEFSAIKKKSRENASRFQELKKIAEEKYNTGLDITEETEAVKAIAADEDALKKRVLEIMRSIYGKKWQPSPMDKSSFRL